MLSRTDEKKVRSGKRRELSASREALMRQLLTLPGDRILDRILGDENPRGLVQSLPSGDFFWLIKKVGEEDCLPLLELASVEQWQYLLDLEIWKRDRLDMTRTTTWIKRLLQADSARLVRWLFGQGERLASYHLFKGLEVVVLEEEEKALDLPEGFFSLDGIFHIRIVDSEHREAMENLLREMARVDYQRYQALIHSLVGLIPAETEEEMYRVRNVRLAEHGFLPPEEAVSVYAPLEPDALEPEGPETLPDGFPNEEVRAMVPASPLYHAETQNMLTEATSRIEDPLWMDKIRLEFAGLCNQIISADGISVPELDVLLRTCQRAARYLNLALERVCGKDLSRAEQVLKTYSLVDLFRVGMGLALKLRWEAERWLQESWFHGRGLDTDFWGERWGGVLAGLMEARPQHFKGPQGGEGYKDFEWLSELGEGLRDLRRLMVLDSLIGRLVSNFPLDEEWVASPEVTFRPLLFNLWGRMFLGLEPSFSALSLEQARSLLGRLRSGRQEPPYEMRAFEAVFLRDLMFYAPDADPEAASILRETLSLIWNEFQEEYEQVSLQDLDPRYSKFIWIRPSPGVAPR